MSLDTGSGREKSDRIAIQELVTGLVLSEASPREGATPGKPNRYLNQMALRACLPCLG